MTNKRWQEIGEWLKMGDPLKDIDCDEAELLDYIADLRKRLKLSEDEA